MKKADCTAEEWQAYLAYAREYADRNREKIREGKRAYHARPEIKERKKIYDRRPDVVARRKEIRREKPQKTKRDWLMRRSPEDWQKALEKQRFSRSGFDNELVERLRTIQNNTCPICRREFSEALPAVGDHCHDAKKPRGLLCNKCNTLEGRIKTLGISVFEFAERLHDYLSNPPFNSVA